MSGIEEIPSRIDLLILEGKSLVSLAEAWARNVEHALRDFEIEVRPLSLDDDSFQAVCRVVGIDQLDAIANSLGEIRVP